MSHCVALYFFRLCCMVHGSAPCDTARALETGCVRTWYLTCHQCLRHSVHLLVVVSVTERVGGNSLFVALVDSESVAIATLWRLLTPTVGVNSLGLI